MDCYSITDLCELLQKERGERIRMDVGSSPKLVLKDHAHEIEGPAMNEEALEAMLRTVANTREMRTFREKGCVDIILPLHGSRFLVRAVRAFDEFRLELQLI
jgi:hypothetical protein